MKNKFYEYLNRLKPRGIQSTLMISFSMISVFIMLILGVVLYIRFSNISRGEIVETTLYVYLFRGKPGGLSGEYAADFGRSVL